MQEENQKKEKLPIGMVIILVLLGIGLIGSLLGLKNPNLMIGPYQFDGTGALVYTLIFMVIEIGLIYGIIKRKKYSLDVLIYWQIYSIVLSCINFISTFIMPQEVLATYQSMNSSSEFEFSMTMVKIMTSVSFVIALVIGFIIIWYVNKKKEFFKN